MLQFKFPFEAPSWRPCWLFTEAKGNDLQLPCAKRLVSSLCPSERRAWMIRMY